MTSSLPGFAGYETFRIWRSDPAQWLPIALDIARSHGLACAAPHVFSTGTNVVVADGPVFVDGSLIVRDRNEGPRNTLALMLQRRLLQPAVEWLDTAVKPASVVVPT